MKYILSLIIICILVSSVQVIAFPHRKRRKVITTNQARVMLKEMQDREDERKEVMKLYNMLKKPLI